MGKNLGKGNDFWVQVLSDGGIVSGNAGNDTITGAISDSFFLGGQGNDILWGDAILNFDIIDDLLEFLTGGGFDDTLYGGQGNDVLYGGGGRDTLMGDGGSDVLWGGSGADAFRFNLNDRNLGLESGDLIMDFRNYTYVNLLGISVTLSTGNDKVVLEQVEDRSLVEVNRSGTDAILEYDGKLIATFDETTVNQVNNNIVFI